MAISGGWDHALALAANGTVWAWGQNGVGELGDGTTNNHPTPVQLLSLSNIVAVSGGDWHSAALAADGTVWKWGRNDVGQLSSWLGTRFQARDAEFIFLPPFFCRSL